MKSAIGPLYQNTPVMMHSIDLDGRLVNVNDHWLKVLGYERSEVSGRKSVEFLTEASCDYATNVAIPEFFKAAMVAKEVEYRFVKKNGEELDVLLSSVGERNESREICRLSCFMIDVTERKQAEQGLRESEERYRRLVELSPDAVVVVSEGKIVFANPAEATLMGASSPEGLIGKSAIEVIHHEDGTTVDERLRRIDEKGEASHVDEGKIVRLDGQVREVEAASAPIIYEGKKAVQIIHRDIAERKRTEQALAYQAHLLENVNDAIIASDERFVTTAWNRAAEEMYGWTAEEIIGRPTVDFLEPEFIEVEPDEVLRRLLEEGRFEGEVIHPRKDGTRIHTEARAMALRDKDGRITGFASIDRDITERKRAENELREQGELYRSLYDNTPVMLHSIDPKDGTILSVNKYWLDVLGFERSEVIGQRSTDFLTPASQRYAVEVALPEFFKAGFAKDIEYQMVKKDGEVIDVLLSAVGGFDESGQMTRTQAFTVDVTDRKRAEQALRDSEERYRTLGVCPRNNVLSDMRH